MFGVIIASLSYIDREDVECNDGFFQIRQMEEAWKINIANEFNPSLINVLENSMM